MVTNTLACSKIDEASWSLKPCALSLGKLVGVLLCVIILLP